MANHADAGPGRARLDRGPGPLCARGRPEGAALHRWPRMIGPPDFSLCPDKLVISASIVNKPVDAVSLQDEAEARRRMPWDAAGARGRGPKCPPGPIESQGQSRLG